MSKVSQKDIEDIVEFIYKYYGSLGSFDTMLNMVKTHIKYNTFMVVRDSEEDIVAVARWNILPNGTDMVILDVVIHPRHRRNDLMHRMVQKGLEMYPSVKYLIYERHDKGKPFVKIPLAKLLKRRF